MAKGKKQIDWTDLLLYGGIFLLVTVFLFQLLKLWNNGINSFTSFLSAIPTAAENTISSIENALTRAVTSPLSSVSSLLSSPISILSWLWSLITGIFTGLVTVLFPGAAAASTLGSMFSSSATPVNVGNGSAYPSTTAGSAVDLGDGYTLTPSGEEGGDGASAFSYTLGQ
jgi:hypothetical protein